nr:hypothetical protein [uncultured Anaerostipes sp.]
MRKTYKKLAVCAVAVMLGLSCVVSSVYGEEAQPVGQTDTGELPKLDEPEPVTQEQTESETDKEEPTIKPAEIEQEKPVEAVIPSNAAQVFVGNVQELINELPAADELRNMTTEEQQAVYEKLQTAYDAYQSLTDEQKEEVIGAEIFDSLFTVFNGMVNVLANQNNYNISEGSVTIEDSCGDNCSSHTITGSSNTNTITVTGGNHNIILDSVNIDVSSTSTSSFSIENNTTVNLTLVGTSTLKGGNDSAGLQLSEEASLIITKESDGNTLNAIGSWLWGAGIGGCYSSSGGDITINGGNINATADNRGRGAAIGGGQGTFEGHVTINGGKVNAQGFDNPGIGGSYDDNSGTGIFKAGGNAVIFASSILDNSDTSSWNGVIFQDNSGKVYAANSSKTITIDTSFEIPDGYTLEIPTGVTLVVPNGVTINNLESIVNNGTIDLSQGGKITGNPPTGSGTILYPKAPTPTVTIDTSKTTASSITVTELENKDTYGGAEYSLDGHNWQPDSVFTDLHSSTNYTIYARYKGNGDYKPSDEGKIENVSTNAANYTITIPAEPVEAGNSESKAQLKPSDSFDLGYGGTATVKVKENSGVDKDGKLTLTRQNDTENYTITSALLVNNNALGDINKSVATFTMSNKTPVSVSFAKPTETDIPAGTYSGTITFVISYSEQ